MSDDLRMALEDTRLFLELLPQDLGRGSLNGMRTQLAYKVDAALAAPPAPQPAGQALTDELPQSTIDCWVINYALHMTPHSLHDHWRDGAPTGAVLALKSAVAEIERLRAHGIKSEE